LKDLFKLFSTDRLNLAMRREAAKLTNNVNTEVKKARKIVQRLIAIHEAGVTSEDEQEEETSRPAMGTISEPVDVSDGSGRYVRLPQEAQTPRPRRSRSGKENDGEAVSPSQLPPRISSGLTVRISNLQVGAGAPVDSSTPQEMESRSLPVIYLDDVANTGRSSPRNARGEGRNGAEEEVGLADGWDLSPGPRARTRLRPDPPQYFFGGGSTDPRQENRGSDGRTRSPGGTRSSSERRGREDIGQRIQDEGGQSSTSHSGPRQGGRGTTHNLDGSRSQSRQRIRGSSAGSRRNGGRECSGTGERSRGAGGGRDEEECDERTRRSKGTRGAVVGQPLRDAAGHPVGEISEGISLGMRSRARSCRA
jgi:hypothetical protein